MNSGVFAYIVTAVRAFNPHKVMGVCLYHLGVAANRREIRKRSALPLVKRFVGEHCRSINNGPNHTETIAQPNEPPYISRGYKIGHAGDDKKKEKEKKERTASKLAKLIILKYYSR